MSNPPKRILHVFSTFEIGGYQRRFANYLKRSNAGHVHSIYAMDGNYSALELVEGIEAPEGGAQLVEKGSTWKAVHQCRKLLKDMRPDLLVTYNWGATEWALANRFFPICPTIHIQDGFLDDELEAEIPKRRLLRRFAYKGCEAVVVPSKQLKQLAGDSWGIVPGKLHYIPNGIEPRQFEGEAETRLLNTYGIEKNDVIIGTVAALRPEKNVGRLIEAFSDIENKFPAAKLVIIGDGVGRSALQMLAERVCQKKRVVFTGNLSAPEQILPAFDIFALSSDTEQMPLSVLEAMATGLPVASTDVGDVRHMVAESNQPYIDGREAKELASSLIGLLENPEKAKAIGADNRSKLLATYTLDQMVERYDALFAEMLP